MKKFAVIFFAAVLVLTFSIPVLAGRTAFENVWMKEYDEDVIYIPNETVVRMGQKIHWMKYYGCGYGTIGDMVEFVGLDFGENGATKVYLPVSYGGDATTTFDLFIDDPSNKPACSFSTTSTGGFTNIAAKELVADVKVPAGKHDIYVKFTNEESGSFEYIRFDQATEPVVAVEGTVGTKKPAADTKKSPEAADMGMIAGIAAIVTSCAGFVALKKKK